MLNNYKSIKYFSFSFIFIFFLVFYECNFAHTNGIDSSQANIIAAARDIISSVRFCGLVTEDENGQPDIRTMDPFPPDDNFIVWLGTNPKSRKVNQIKSNPDVVLYYNDPAGNGYVVIHGSAELINNKKEKAKHWKEEWGRFYPDKDSSFLLIKVIPRKLDVINYKKGIYGDPETWRAASMEIGNNRTKYTNNESLNQLKPYLMFPGTCKEALNFYKECFNGEIVMMQTFAESPIDVPAKFKQRIFNSEFNAKGVHFMASDDLPANKVSVGSNFALFVTFSDSAEEEKVFNKLSKGGKVLFPIGKSSFGMLVDKYNIRWMMKTRE